MDIDKAVDALGRDIGMEGLALDTSGCLTFNVGEDRSLFLERKGDRLAVCLAAACRSDLSGSLAKGFALCHHSHDPGVNMRIGLFKKDIIVCISRLDPHQIRAGMLKGAVVYLMETMEDIL